MIEMNLFKKYIYKNYHIILLYVESKIWHKQAHLQNRNIFMDIKNRFMVAKAKVIVGREGVRCWG